MKMKNVFVLLAAITLVACSSNSATKTSSSINGDSTTSSDVQTTSDSSNNAGTSSNTDIGTSSSNPGSSSNNTGSSSTNTGSSSSQPSTDNELTFGFFNPSCGTAGSNTLNDTLKSYMNGVAKFAFVSSVSNTNCQIMDTAPSDGYSRLTIGSAKNSGELEFTFANTIKTVKATVVTYYKYYNNANHPDNPSECYIINDTNKIDVTAEADNEPVEREATFDVNAKKVKIYNKGASNRVYIKELTFTY